MAYQPVKVSKNIVDRLLILEKCLGINHYNNAAKLVAAAAKEIKRLRNRVPK